MEKEQCMVSEFHAMTQQSRPQSPGMPNKEVCRLRIGLIRDEYEELMEAYDEGDFVNLAKEIADLLYVVLGAAVEAGIRISPVFEEVHKSNMTKTYRDSKIWKLENWVSPSIMTVLIKQGFIPPAQKTANLSCDEKTKKLLPHESEPPHQGDGINKVSYYNQGKIEVIEFVEDQDLGFHLGNAVKYICRAGAKKSEELGKDLKKAIYYIKRYIAKSEKRNDITETKNKGV